MFNISDDVTVFGMTQANQDKALQVSEVSLTLNKHDCEFKHSGKGISPGERKLKQLRKLIHLHQHAVSEVIWEWRHRCTVQKLF